MERAEQRKQAKQMTPAQHNISGDNSLRVPPVPIPNTEVKPQHADGTWLATARESRSSPDSISLSSSMAEHSAVNRRVVGSSPTRGARILRVPKGTLFYLLDLFKGIFEAAMLPIPVWSLFEY